MTGAGMMDCKTALTETDGDMEAAVDWLRAKGISKADKKAGRTAAEGLIGVASAPAQGRRRRGQLRDRLRRPQRRVPGNRVRNRQGGACDGRQPRGDRRGEAPRPARVGRRDDQGRDRHDRREHDAPPLGAVGSSTARSRPMSTTRSPTASASSACWSRSRSTGDQGKLARSAARSRCMSPRPTRSRCAPTKSIRPPSSASGRSSPSRRGVRQAGRHHREDGRRPPAQVLRGSRAPEAGLRHQSRPDRREGAEGGRRRTSAPRPRSPASSLPPRRGHREGRDDFAAEVAAAAGVEAQRQMKGAA